MVLGECGERSHVRCDNERHWLLLGPEPSGTAGRREHGRFEHSGPGLNTVELASSQVATVTHCTRFGFPDTKAEDFSPAVKRSGRYN